jgi:hypothetical protein
MRITDFAARTAGVLGAVALLAGCGGSAGSGSFGAIPPGISPPKPTDPGPSQFGPAALSAHDPLDAAKNLYVANYNSDAVTVYAPGTSTPLRTIAGEAGQNPLALNFDAAENLYIANQSNVNSDVTVYAPGSTKVLRTLSQSIVEPNDIVFDKADNAYVSNSGGNSVTIYNAESTELKQEVVDGVASPTAMAFDKKGKLYVANAPTGGPYTITVYARDSRKLVRSISLNAMNGSPGAIAFDKRDDLYVSQSARNVNGGYKGYVTVYKHGKDKILRTITDGLLCPSARALIFDGSGNLYVANGACNNQNGSIAVYASGQTMPIRTITDSIFNPCALAIGSSGYLNVANNHTLINGNGSITEYAPNSTKVARTILQGVDAPVSLAFGP